MVGTQRLPGGASLGLSLGTARAVTILPALLHCLHASRPFQTSRLRFSDLWRLMPLCCSPAAYCVAFSVRACCLLRRCPTAARPASSGATTKTGGRL